MLRKDGMQNSPVDAGDEQRHDCRIDTADQKPFEMEEIIAIARAAIRSRQNNPFRPECADNQEIHYDQIHRVPCLADDEKEKKQFKE